HAIGGVAVLLNFDQHVAGADGVKPSGRQKHGIALLHANRVNMIGRGTRLNGFLKLFASDLLAESDEKFGASFSSGDVPTFRFRFPTEFRGDFLGRMDLERKFLLGVEQFDQKREPWRLENIAEN